MCDYVQLLQIARGHPSFRISTLDGLHYIYLALNITSASGIYIESFLSLVHLRFISVHLFQCVSHIPILMQIFIQYNRFVLGEFLGSYLVSVDARLDQSHPRRINEFLRINNLRFI